MELNKSCIEILQDLREKGDFVKIQDLAQKYKLTDRAIRYKIDKIEKFLVKNGFQYLERQHVKGIKLLKDANLDKFLDHFVGEYTPYKYVYSKDERFKFIILKLLQSNEAINLNFFQTKLCISKNTVLKEMNEVESWLGERGLKLSRKPRVGIMVEGSEEDKRKSIMEIASQSISTEDIVNYIDRRMVQSKINNLQFNILFSDLDVDFIDKLIRKAEKELDRQFSDEAYGSLITHISIMIKRLQLNKTIYLPEVNMDAIKCRKEYDVAKTMIENIETYYNINVPQEESSYIVLHLLGAKVIKNSEILNDKEEYNAEHLYDVINSMTDDMEAIYNVNFGENKLKLIEGLVMHLRPSIYRIKFGFKLINPLLREIKLNYKELFINTKKVVRYLEDYVGKEINEHEVSYIALHYGAALKNAEKRKDAKARVILVCGTGIGTAKMVASQIVNEFDVEIVDTIASRTVKFLEKDKFDFIISTVTIPEIHKDAYIKVNPLLLRNDYDKLKKYLNIKYRGDTRKDEIQIVNRVMEIVEKYCDIKDRNQLQYELMYQLKKSTPYNKQENFQYNLSDLLKWDMIKLNEKCTNWKDVIKKGTSILIEKNYVEESYEKAIINNLKNIGPYMVVAPGIVLSHAKPEDGVNTLSMSLMTLRNPIRFGSELNDPVKLVITLAAKDEKTHLKALEQLMDLFLNSDDLNIIFNATNKEQVIEILNKYSK